MIYNTTWTLITTTAANATTYTNTGLIVGPYYYYLVRAVNAITQSAYSSSDNDCLPPTGTQTYSSGSGTWTAPTCPTTITIKVWGGGGDGGCYYSFRNAGGGGSGGYAESTVASTSGQTFSYSVGAGLATNCSSVSNAAGSTVTFGTTTITTYGGRGGNNATSTAGGSDGPGAPVGSGGNVANLAGNPGTGGGYGGGAPYGGGNVYLYNVGSTPGGGGEADMGVHPLKERPVLQVACNSHIRKVWEAPLCHAGLLFGHSTTRIWFKC